MQLIKQSISFFTTLFGCVTLYLLLDIFILKNSDIEKWGSQLSAFEIGLFFTFLFVISNMTGHLLFLILLSLLKKSILVESKNIISIITGIGCFLFMIIFSNWFYLPNWFQIEIVNDVVSLMISWAMVAFLMSLVVFICLNFIRNFQINSGT